MHAFRAYMAALLYSSLPAASDPVTFSWLTLSGQAFSSGHVCHPLCTHTRDLLCRSCSFPVLCPICQAKSDPRCAACSRREAIITAAQVTSLKQCAYQSLQAAAISSGLKPLVLQDRPGPWLWTTYLVPTVQATSTAMHLIYRHRENSLRSSLRHQNSTILMTGGG